MIAQNNRRARLTAAEVPDFAIRSVDGVSREECSKCVTLPTTDFWGVIAGATADPGPNSAETVKSSPSSHALDRLHRPQRDDRRQVRRTRSGEAAGIVYADRAIEIDHDYKRVAFLPYATLELEIADPGSPLLDRVKADAAAMQARRGEHFRISTCGQTVLLGESK